MGKYVQMSGGKRVRPAVLLMAARLCGYTGDRGVLNAAVVEFIHTATLVHDDIIDGAETRRGRLTAHSRWGSDITVLLGDYLYIRSMAMALTQDTLEVVRLLCDCHAADDRGRALPAHQDRRREHHRRRALRDHPPQDGVPVLRLRGNRRPAGHTPRPAQRAALRDYGFNLGIAFQIVDDVLDYMADESALGKPIGGDLREGKVTLPIILLLQRAGPEARTHQWHRRRRSVARELAGDQGPAAPPRRGRRRVRARRRHAAAPSSTCRPLPPSNATPDALTCSGRRDSVSRDR